MEAKKVFYSLLGFLNLVFLALILFGVKKYNINIGVVLYAIEIAYCTISFDSVNADEIAAMYFYGKFIKELKPGPHIIPILLFQMQKFPKTEIKNELPAEPEKIFRSKDDYEPVPDGKFLPIRIKFGRPDPDDKDLENDPYNITMVADVVPVISWKITSVKLFFENYGTIENCLSILTDKAIEVFGDEFSKITPAKALTNLFSTSQRLEDQLKLEVGDFTTSQEKGVKIADAYVQPFRFSHDLNKSVTEAKSIEVLANANMKKTILEGKGKAESEEMMNKVKAAYEELRLVKKALGMEKLLEKCKTSEGQFLLWMDTMGEALAKSNYTIIPGDKVFAAFAGVNEMLNNLKGGNK